MTGPNKPRVPGWHEGLGQLSKPSRSRMKVVNPFEEAARIAVARANAVLAAARPKVPREEKMREALAAGDREYERRIPTRDRNEMDKMRRLKTRTRGEA